MTPGASAAATIVLVAWVAAVRAQHPEQPAFRAEVNLVRLAVRALDDQNRPINDLTAYDLQVLEDGTPQTIDTLKLAGSAQQRATLGGTTTLPSASIDVETSRIYLIVVDNYHLSPIEVTRAQLILKDFLARHLLAGDVAAIIIASGGGQDFTDDLDLLLKTVDTLRVSALRPSGPGFAGRAEQRIRASSLLNTITGSAKWMSREESRRKTVILISSDVGCTIFGCGSELTDAIRAARNGEASIYGVPPNGLSVPGYRSPEVGGGLPESAAVGSSRGSRPAVGRRMGPLSSLSMLAQDTGGFVIADTNNIGQGLDRMVADSRSYYLLTYYSNNELKSGKTHHIVLTTPRKNVRLFYRQSYVVGGRQ